MLEGSLRQIDRHRMTLWMVVILRKKAVQWHRLESLESGTVIVEMKDGAYEPIGEGDVLSR